MKLIKQITVLIALSLAAIEFTNGYAQGPQQKLIQVLFSESEPGIEPYTTRLLLGEQYLRLDDGSDDSDYLLFDLNTRDIHSFSHEDETHLVIKSGPAQKVDFKIDFQIQQQTLDDAPKIGGIVPAQHRFYADSCQCRESINVKGMLPGITQAMIDYEQALVVQNQQTFERVPNSLKTSCYMANNFLYASAYLEQGFPMLVSDYLGKRKQLISYAAVDKPLSLMQFKNEYRVYYPGLSKKAQN